MKKTTLLAAFCAVSMHTSHLFAQQAGALDTTFGTGGIVISSNGNGQTSYILGMVIQPDGKILSTGAANNGNPVVGLVRYNVDGSFDTSFDSDGKVQTGFSSGGDYGTALAIQADGKIVVAGNSSGVSDPDILIARYHPNGSLDTSFNSVGKVTTNITTLDYGNGLAIQADGKIVVVGSVANNDILVLRYNTNGSLDTSFDTDGIVTTNIDVFGEAATAVAIQPDGKIVITGYTFIGATTRKFLVARYNTNGSLDTSFDTDGIAMTTLPAFSCGGTSIALQNDGKILTTSFADSSGHYSFLVARYNTNGSLDTSFDTDGIAKTTIDTSNAFATSLAVQSDGKIVVAGTGGDNLNGTHQEFFAVVRYNTNGSLDTSLNSSGIIKTHVDTVSLDAYAVALQADGKILVAGQAVKTPPHMVTARYLGSTSVGVVDLAADNNAIYIYPNPVQDRATLEYTLTKQEDISIQLFDLYGKNVATYVQSQTQMAGDYKQAIQLPEGLPNGVYFITLSSSNGKITVKITK